MKDIFDIEVTGVINSYNNILETSSDTRLRSLIALRAENILQRYASEDFIFDDTFDLSEYLYIPVEGSKLSQLEVSNFSMLRDYLVTIFEMQSAIEENYANFYNRFLFERNEIDKIKKRVEEKSKAVDLYRGIYSSSVSLKNIANQWIERNTLYIDENRNGITLEESSREFIPYEATVRGDGRSGDPYNSRRRNRVLVSAIYRKDNDFYEYTKKSNSVMCEVEVQLSREAIVNSLNISLFDYEGKDKDITVYCLERGERKLVYTGKVKGEGSFMFPPSKCRTMYVQISSTEGSYVTFENNGISSEVYRSIIGIECIEVGSIKFKNSGMAESRVIKKDNSEESLVSLSSIDGIPKEFIGNEVIVEVEDESGTFKKLYGLEESINDFVKINDSIKVKLHIRKTEDTFSRVYERTNNFKKIIGRVNQFNLNDFFRYTKNERVYKKLLDSKVVLNRRESIDGDERRLSFTFPESLLDYRHYTIEKANNLSVNGRRYFYSELAEAANGYQISTDRNESNIELIARESDYIEYQPVYWFTEENNNCILPFEISNSGEVKYWVPKSGNEFLPVESGQVTLDFKISSAKFYKKVGSSYEPISFTRKNYKEVSSIWDISDYEYWIDINGVLRFKSPETVFLKAEGFKEETSASEILKDSRNHYYLKAQERGIIKITENTRSRRSSVRLLKNEPERFENQTFVYSGSGNRFYLSHSNIRFGSVIVDDSEFFQIPYINGTEEFSGRIIKLNPLNEKPSASPNITEIIFASLSEIDRTTSIISSSTLLTTEVFTTPVIEGEFRVLWEENKIEVFKDPNRSIEYEVFGMVTTDAIERPTYSVDYLNGVLYTNKEDLLAGKDISYEINTAHIKSNLASKIEFSKSRNRINTSDEEVIICYEEVREDTREISDYYSPVVSSINLQIR